MSPKVRRVLVGFIISFLILTGCEVAARLYLDWVKTSGASRACTALGGTWDAPARHCASPESN